MAPVRIHDRWTLFVLCVAACLGCIGCRLLHVESAVGPVAQRVPALSEETLAFLASQLKRDEWRQNLQWAPLSAWQNRNQPVDGHTNSRWLFGNDSPESLIAEVDFGEAESLPPSQAANNAKSDSTTTNTSHEAVAETALPKRHDTTDTKMKDENSPAAKIPQPSSADSPSAVSEGTSQDDVADILKEIDAHTLDREQSKDRTANRYLAALAKRDNLVGWNAAILWAWRDPRAANAVLPVLERLATKPPKYAPVSSEENQSAESETGLAKTTNEAHEKNGEEDSTPGPLKSAIDRILGTEATKPEKDLARLELQSARMVAISPAMRAAATEAWCRVLGIVGDDAIESLAPAGTLLGKPGLPYEIRGELFRSVAMKISPHLIPGLEHALREEEDETRAPQSIRRAAIEACLLYALWNVRKDTSFPDHSNEVTSSILFNEAIWPKTINNCQFDPDSRVRKSYGQWLAVVRHPRGFQILKAQLFDTEIRVHQSALSSLGLLGTADARAELRSQMRRTEELIRLHAVKGLAYWGTEEIAPFIDDSSGHVRRTLAEELARQPDVESALLLRDLLTDRDPQVQTAVVTGISSWPDQLALPLLLQGMRESAQVTRKRCYLQLRRRTHTSEPFDFAAPRKQRLHAVDRIARAGKLPDSYLDRIRRTGLHKHQQIDELQIAEIRSYLAATVDHAPQSPPHVAAMQRLLQLSASDLPIIERLLLEEERLQHETIFREVLPELSDVYTALLELTHTDVFVRRRGAQRIAHAAESASLSPLALRELHKRLLFEQDRMVWRYAMQAVMHDGSGENSQIALLALNHSWPDIRILGCQYVSRYGRAEFANWILPLLHDNNKNVQFEAVKAAGQCRNPILIDGVIRSNSEESLPGLRPLLTVPNSRLRLAVAVSMSRLGDRQGMQELVRQSYHQSQKMRIQVIEQMGQSGQTRFTEHLIRMAWTESNDGVKRAILASLNLLIPAENHPDGLADEPTFDAKIKRWVSWWEKRNQIPISQQAAM